MRKFQKQQFLDIITSLHILHQESRDRLEKKDYLTVQTALADSQEAAIQLGEAIERVAGNGTKAVECLEQYCDKLYQISVQLEEISGQKFYKSLESILIKAENAINHIPVRKEIVFLPYKASMWDSLESVYLAAREDKDCDVYVVPIPYYDRRADKSLGELHYEGSEYPKDIVITDYREYDLEERRPDVIYIHNPYDNWNNVTCVPEYYFCKNLRNFTNCLVYIPYFVLDEIEPGNEKAVEKMKHFCFVPGVMYAHKVIVQSEKMRQIYINEYANQAKSVGLPIDMKALKENIQGIGSPKFDKVQSVKKENLDIPDEWLEIIKKPDGSWKRIIFYNTSINALLRSDDKMLEKMQSVFLYFQEVRDDMALLWRPHPLIPNTIKSMRPALWDKYEKIVKSYRQENWGIYDDSSDMDRAIALSDGYYGDYSSIVHLYKKTGKPILMQDANNMFENCTEDKKSFAPSICWYVENNKAWYIDIERSILFSVEIDTQKCEFEAKIPGEGANSNESRMVSVCIKYEDSIFCMPDNNKYILVYQLSDKKFSKIEIDNPDNERIFILSSYLYEDRIFAISYGLKKLVEIDADNKTISNYYTFDTDEILPVVTVCGRVIYSLLHHIGQLICFDMKNKETTSYMLPDISRRFNTVCCDGERYWFSGYRNEVYVWNRMNGTMDIIDGFPQGFGMGDRVYKAEGIDISEHKKDEYDLPAFMYSVALEGHTWFIPCLTNKILYADHNTFKIEEFKIDDESGAGLSSSSENFHGKYVLEYVREERYIGLFSTKNKCIYEIDAKEMEVKRCNYYYSEACLQEVKNAIAKENMVYENDILNLKNYFNQPLEDSTLNSEKSYESIGINIHKEVMREVSR